MKKIVLAALAVLMVSLPLAAQEMPPGRWWRKPEVVSQLGLTAEQQNRLDAAFRNAANALIDGRADVEKLQLALRNELDQPELNRANLQRIAVELSAARGRLFERELMMLADMRAVLSEQQWTRLRTELERRRDQGQRPKPRR